LEIEDAEEGGDGKPGKLTLTILVLVGVLIPALIAAFLVYDLQPPFTPGPNTTAGVLVIIPSGAGSPQALNFEPATLRVVAGLNSTITWNEKDPIPHTVTSQTLPPGASSFDSPQLNKGDSYSVTLTVPGTFKYYCRYHPGWMIGTIIVSAPPSG